MRDPNPTDILNRAIGRGLVNNIRPLGTPGEIINKLRPQDREILKQLKSTDIERIRVLV